MESTLSDALEEVFLGVGDKDRKKEPADKEPSDEGKVSNNQLLERAKQKYNKAQKYLRQGNFSAYAAKIEELGNTLERL